MSLFKIKLIAELAHPGTQRGDILVIDIFFTEVWEMFAPKNLVRVFMKIE